MPLALLATSSAISGRERIHAFFYQDLAGNIFSHHWHRAASPPVWCGVCWPASTVSGKQRHAFLYLQGRLGGYWAPDNGRVVRLASLEQGLLRSPRGLWVTGWAAWHFCCCYGCFSALPFFALVWALGEVKASSFTSAPSWKRRPASKPFPSHSGWLLPISVHKTHLIRVQV